MSEYQVNEIEKLHARINDLHAALQTAQSALQWASGAFGSEDEAAAWAKVGSPALRDISTAVKDNTSFMKKDMLEEMFRRQGETMDLLIMGDKLPECPIDISSKPGQRLIKELIFAMIEEMAEASFILKNRAHRFTDHTDVDFAHFKEELADAYSYFVEICKYAGISAQELYEEYCRKNNTVKERIRTGY